MTPIEALNILEDRMQHIPASIPLHIQIKQIIDSVRQETVNGEDRESPENARENASKTKTGRPEKAKD